MSLLDWAATLARALLETPAQADRPKQLIAAAPLPLAVFRCGVHELVVASESWRTLFGPHDHASCSILEALRHAEEMNAPFTVPELRFKHADNSAAIERACRLVIQPVQLAESANGLIATCTDTTDDVIARRMQVKPSSLIWSGRQSDADYANTSWHGYTQGATATAASDDWRDYVFADDLAQCEQALADAVKTNKPLESEARLRRSDGTYRWHQVRFTCDEAPRWFATAWDIEDTHYAQKQRIELLDRLLVALNEAESANRAKDSFLAVVSHELRAPVTTIMLWEKVLRDHLEDIPLRARALDAIRDSASAQSRLVGDLLDISRAISGKLRLERRRISIDGVLAAAVEAALPAANAKEIQISVDIRPRLGRILADSARLRQVFDNLLSNAVKFTPKGGSIQVRADRERGSLRVAITDTGRGIEEQFLRRLFTPFVQNEEVLTRSEGGLGLGLAITKQLVSLHDGTLAADSPGPNRGSTFTVTVPLANRRTATPAAPVAEPAPAPPRRLDSIRVLLVEDEPRVREALKLLLARAGADVEAAASAEEARQFLERIRPDVLICDISMPGEDGYTFIRTLRSNGGAAHDVPAIALTAYASDRDRERAAAAGFDAHLAKPIQLQGLAAAIDHLLAERRPQIA